MAIAWLGEVLIALSSSVTAYNAVQALQQPPQPPQPPPGAGGSWRWFGWVRGAAGQAGGVGSGDKGSNRSNNGGGGGGKQSNSDGSGSSTREQAIPTGMNPDGAPSAAAGEPQASQSDAEAEAELLRAVGVVPSFARAVAAELRAASDRAGAPPLHARGVGPNPCRVTYLVAPKRHWHTAPRGREAHVSWGCRLVFACLNMYVSRERRGGVHGPAGGHGDVHGAGGAGGLPRRRRGRRPRSRRRPARPRPRGGRSRLTTLQQV